jgi:hypothetical protein
MVRASGWLLARSGRLLARNAGAGWYAGRDARHHTRQASGPARAVCGLLAGSWRVLGVSWRVTPVRAGTPVGTRAAIRASGPARAVCGCRAGCWSPGGVWRVLGGVWREALARIVSVGAEAFERLMSCLIRNLKPSRQHGHARNGTGVSCGAARREADDTSEAKRMIPKAPARGISSEAKPDQKRRVQDQSGAHPAAMVRERYGCRAPQRWFGRYGSAPRMIQARSAAPAHQRNTRRLAGTGRLG